MGGQTTNTTTQESGLSNPAMNAAATTIGNQLNAQLQGGVKPFTGSLAPNLSSQTMAGVNALTGNPNNQTFASGVSGALENQAAIAGGNMADDPVRQRIMEDAGTAVNATFANSGRFGGGTHREGLGEGVASALANFDYGRQQQAIQNLPGLYQAGLMPAGAQLQGGQILDAQNLAQAQDAARLFDVQNNQGWNTLQRGASIFSGTAPISGTTGTTTQSQQLPWWSAPLGIGAGIASFL